jgi:hypothetical protein
MFLVELIFEPAEGSLALGGQGHGTVRGPVALVSSSARRNATRAGKSPGRHPRHGQAGAGQLDRRDAVAGVPRLSCPRFDQRIWPGAAGR